MKNENKTYNLSMILTLLGAWVVIFALAITGLTYFLIHQSKSAGSNDAIFKFQHPNLFWIALVLIPFFVGVFLLIRWKNKKLQLFSQSARNAGVTPKINNKALFLKLFFILNSIIFGIIALANPMYGQSTSKTKNDGIEMIIALDISNSMLADDIAGGKSRLSIAKKAIEELLNNLHGDKVGFVVFAGNAFTQMPMTTDYEGAKLFLQPIEPSMISNQGTNISEAIRVAMRSFDETDDKGKTIILITDGEDQQKGAMEMAKEAKEKGIVINAIGMGTQEGGMVPDYYKGKFDGYKKDQEGNIVISKINETLVQNLAIAGGGVSIISDKISLDLTELVNRVVKIERKEVESDEYEVGVSRYLIFAMLSFLCLTATMLISNFNWFKR